MCMTDQPDRIRTQSDPVATDMMCRECQHCGVDVITQRLWYPGGQCRNCGSYAFSEVTSLAHDGADDRPWRPGSDRRAKQIVERLLRPGMRTLKSFPPRADGSQVGHPPEHGLQRVLRIS